MKVQRSHAQGRMRPSALPLLFAIWSMMCLSLSPRSSIAQDSDRRVAVLDFKNSAGLTTFEVTSLTSIVRGSASRLAGYSVMTKENIAVMLPPDKSIEDCVGSCEVETGKLLGAAFVITGEIGRVEGQLQLSMRLFDTAKGSLLGQEVVVGPDMLTVQTELGASSQSLLSKLSVASVGASAESGSAVLLKVSPANVSLSLNDGPLFLDKHPKKGEGYLVRLKPGKYTLRGEASGYLSSEEQFVLVEGALIEVNLSLNKALKRDTSCDASDPACRGELMVVTSPAGARLWVDGKRTELVTAPSRRDPSKGSISLSLPPGEHVIEARLAKHQPAKGRVTLKRDDINQTFQRDPLILTPNHGSLSVESEPVGATVFLDDKMVGVTPWRAEKVEAGPHKLRLFKEDYRTINEVVVIERGKPSAQSLTLKPTFAELSVEARSEGEPVSGVAVMVDQKLIGKTDESGRLGLGRQSEGARQLQLLHPLYEPLVTSIEVQAGDSRTERALLQPAYATLSVSVKDGIEARVELDGEEFGVTPFTKRVPSGNVILGVIPKDQARYAVFKKKLALGVKERAEVEADCSARLGTLMVVTTPPEADVFVDGKKVGVSPVKAEVFQGSREVRVSLPGFVSVTESVSVSEGKLERLRLELPSDPQVAVTCVPGGVVFVDGERVGPTPQLVTRKAGRYKIFCEFGKLREYRSVTLSDRREELTLKILPSLLKEQEALRSSKQLKMWIGVAGVAVFGGLALYDGVIQLGAEVEARDQAIARLDAPTAWEHDEQAQWLSLRGMIWGTLASSSAVYALYQWLSAPPAVRLSTDVKAQSLVPVLSPTGVGLMGRF